MEEQKNEIIIPTNKYQTPITQELLDSLNEEIRGWFMEAITTIPLIRNLISPSRPLIKDWERDSQGRAIIDITNPPIIENVDYFR